MCVCVCVFIYVCVDISISRPLNPNTHHWFNSVPCAQVRGGRRLRQHVARL